jgi:Na+/melibiose symporter-like transporter
MEKVMGQAQAYAAFFIGTALMAVPAILLAFWCARLLKRRMAGEASAEATNRELDAGAKAPA